MGGCCVGVVGAAASLLDVTQPSSSSSAAAVVKISQKAVVFQDHLESDKLCVRCVQHQPSDACNVVDGTVRGLFAVNRQSAVIFREFLARLLAGQVTLSTITIGAYARRAVSLSLYARRTGFLELTSFGRRFKFVVYTLGCGDWKARPSSSPCDRRLRYPGRAARRRPGHGDGMKANIIFASAALFSANAQPTYIQQQNLSAAAAADEVQHLQELRQVFLQSPSQAMIAPLFLPQYETDHGEIASYHPNAPPLAE